MYYAIGVSVPSLHRVVDSLIQDTDSVHPA